MVFVAGALLVPHVRRSMARLRAIDDGHRPLLRVVNDRLLSSYLLRYFGHHHDMPGVFFLIEILDRNQIAGTQFLNRLELDKAFLSGDGIMVTRRRWPATIEPTFERFGSISVRVHQEMIDEA